MPLQKLDVDRPLVEVESPVDLNGTTRTMVIGNSSHLVGESEFWRATCGYAVHFSLWDGHCFQHSGSFFPKEADQ